MVNEKEALKLIDKYLQSELDNTEVLLHVSKIITEYKILNDIEYRKLHGTQFELTIFKYLTRK